MIGKESNATINHLPLPVMPIKIDVHTYLASYPPRVKTINLFLLGHISMQVLTVVIQK